MKEQRQGGPVAVITCEQQWEGDADHRSEMQITFLLPRAKNHWSKAKGKEDQLLPSAPVHCTSSSHGDIDKLARSTLDGCAVRSGVPHRRRLTGGVAGIGETLRRAFRTHWGRCSFANCTLNNFLSAAKMGPNWIHSGSALHPFGGSSA